MTPSSPKRAALLAVAAFAVVYGLLAWRGMLRGPFRIDEAHKLSETRHLRLLLEGRFDDREWFATIVDRTNPPVGKYLFGAAALLAGVPLPEQASLAREAGGDAYIPPTFSNELSEPYRPLLLPARRAALIATSLTAAILVFVVARRIGALPALIALALHATNFLTTAYGASAVFDPLLTLFTTAAVAVAVALWRDDPVPRGVAIAAGVGAGLFAALAFQTRFTGAVALGAALLLGGVRPAMRGEWRTLARFALFTILLFTIVAVALNPYYWSAPARGTVEARFADASPLPMRVVERFRYQLDDMDALLQKTRTRTPVLESVPEKSRFAFEIIGGDLPGLLLILGAFLGIALIAARLIPRLSGAAALVAWGTLVPFTICGWLPVAWPRYLMVCVPPLAAAAAAGFSALAVLARRRKERS